MVNEPTTYDHVRYPGMPFAETHPDRLRVLGSLYGMQAAPVSRCRVLELGCGVGGNLIPMAYDWPDSRFVGIDLSSTAIEQGKRQLGELGLSNIELRHCDILDVTEEFGEFDYIIAHGVYAWVPPHVREKMLSIFRSNLAPQGIVYVSYNSHPWSHIRNLTRDIMLYHVRGIADTQERIGQARGLLKFLAETATDKAYGAVLREQQERTSKVDDEVFYHDDLSPHFTAFWLYQVVEDAARHGLQYLADASFARPQLGSFSERIIETLSAIPETEIVAREQYLDFVRGNSFRKTLLCHHGVELSKQIGPHSMQGL
jgi:SAM-dependent methyltransferase